MRRIANAVYPLQKGTEGSNPSLSARSRTGVLLPLLIAIITTAGCTTRTLTIESDPPGAEIILLHRDEATRAAYRPAIVHHDTGRFLLDTPPFDALADLFGSEDHQVVRVTLDPDPTLASWEQGPAGREALLQGLRDRADALRSRSREAGVEAAPRIPLLPGETERR